MKTILLCLGCVLGSFGWVEIASAQSSVRSPHLELETQLRADTQITLHAPAIIFATSATAVAALGLTTSIFAISHCSAGADACSDRLSRRTEGALVGSLIAAGITLTSLIWLLSRAHRRAKARRALSVFGAGVRF